MKIKSKHVKTSRFKEVRGLVKSLTGITGRSFKAKTGKSVLMIERDDGLSVNPARWNVESLVCFYSVYDKYKSINDWLGVVNELKDLGADFAFDGDKGGYHLRNTTELLGSVWPDKTLFIKAHLTYNVPEPINVTQDYDELCIWAALVSTDLILGTTNWYY